MNPIKYEPSKLTERQEERLNKQDARIDELSKNLDKLAHNLKSSAERDLKVDSKNLDDLTASADAFNQKTTQKSVGEKISSYFSSWFKK
jgi:small-conductance mechanosensitive channel